MKYENLSRLIDEIKVNIEGDGFFHAYIDIKNVFNSSPYLIDH